MKFKGAVVVFMAGAVLLAACGDSSGGESEANPALVAALAEAMGESGFAGGAGAFDAEASTCAATKVVDDVGAERLTELGITADGVPRFRDVAFTDDEIDDVVGAFGDCADLSRVLADALADDGALTPEQADCFAEEFPEDEVLVVFELDFTDSNDEPPASFRDSFEEVAAECNLDLSL